MRPIQSLVSGSQTAVRGQVQLAHNLFANSIGAAIHPDAQEFQVGSQRFDTKPMAPNAWTRYSLRISVRLVAGTKLI
jgi:hypothetical protein